MPVYVYFAAALVAASIVVLVWALTDDRSVDTVRANLARGGPLSDGRQIALTASARTRMFDPLFETIGRAARGFTGSATARRTQRKLELAGLYDTGWTVERILVVRALSLAIGIFVALSMLSDGAGRNSVLMALVAVVIGYLAPNAWLDRRVSERKRIIERQLPGIMDQLTVSAEAGLGFDAAMARSAEGRSGPLADELSRVLQDIQVGVSRQEALDRMVERTDSPDLRHFVVSVRQSTRHGLPIARTLRIQSEELREKRRSRVEEKAASLPVKIVFPLVLCILPSLFVVILGPAILDIRDSF